MRKYIFVCILLQVSCQAEAQSVSTLMGARAQGVGYASSCLTDEWAIFNNVGGLGRVEKASTSFTYLRVPALKSFSRMAVAVALPSRFGTAGFGVFKFGDDLYSEQLVTVGFSNTFGIASLGAQVNYIQYNAEGFGSKGVVSFNFGGIARFTEQLSIGAHITNLFQPKLTEDGEEHLPTLLFVGIGFTPSEKLLLTTEMEKDLDYPFTWKTGIEYKIFKKFALRTGFNVQPNAGFFGFGFFPENFQLDYAYSFHTELRANHQATVSYRFKSKKV